MKSFVRAVAVEAAGQGCRGICEAEFEAAAPVDAAARRPPAARKFLRSAEQMDGERQRIDAEVQRRPAAQRRIEEAVASRLLLSIGEFCFDMGDDEMVFSIPALPASQFLRLP